ncbi:ABC transporter ATP-binding protein [Wenjunlia tyrosinilytica]|jgi:ABC-2 type transport system ATP-binding protein/ribosome-dependent ATPase|uniref:Multidrug ABC transporter ATP-binding protein n=1 Tax=Wenjunlia tyrosinilytica TaxID=1544741 RepID=A0A917ZF09_9ACTN|nr:ABC transporter ATP-binding protein [Wenjunlia tyrosinilytica]GGO81322.1 multidrug ABC transporter ATP-binding protein [Wenjunlia tyrosinilytica]
MSTPDAPLVEVEGATRRFGSFTAVDNVSMRVERGEIVGLLGANGAGKTTLIKMVLGLIAPTGGTLRLFGREPSRQTRRQLGYVAQGLGLYADLTVRENLAFVAEAFGRPRPSELPGPLRGTEDRLVGEIGWGLQRQLAFVAALGHGPKLLVLDEPTSGVDPLARARLWDTVHEQADSGTGVLVTTHYMQEAQQCDRLVLMSRGRQVAAGTEKDIIGPTTAVEVRTDAWARAFDALIDAGLPATLAGRHVRVADTALPRVGEALERAGLRAEVRQVPATLEERMTSIDRAA